MTGVPFDRFTRAARPVKVVDGDTLDLVIDLGFKVTREERVRLLGVDTPELRSSDWDERARAVEAKEFVEDWLAASDVAAWADDSWPGEWPLVIRSVKRGKYGRLLARVWAADGRELGKDLLAADLGKLYLGR